MPDYIIPRILASTLTVVLGCVACGPNMHFAQRDRPGWLVIDGPRVHKRPGRIDAVGGSPVTTHVRSDLDLAGRDARSQVANMLSSTVVSRSMVWTMQMSHNDDSDDEQVVAQDVEIRSDLRIEHAKVVASYRDEGTRTAYVRLVIDSRAWAADIEKRLSGRLAKIRTKTQQALRQQRAGQWLGSYRTVREAYAIGATLGKDVRVLDLLAPGRAFGKEVAAAKQALDDARSQIRSKMAVIVSVRCPNGHLARGVSDGLIRFLKSHGLQAAALSKRARLGVHIQVDVSQRPMGRNAVGRRIEYTSGGQARLRVADGHGKEVVALAINLPGRRHVERGNSPAEAAKRALTLASETVVARFRSKFRRHFVEIESP